MAIEVNQDLAAEVGGSLLPTGVYQTAEEIPDDRVLLFTADGLRYTVTKEIQPNVVFRYFRNLRKLGDTEALAHLLHDVLGEDVMDVLAENTNLTKPEFQAVMRAAQKHTMGAAQDLMGN